MGEYDWAIYLFAVWGLIASAVQGILIEGLNIFLIAHMVGGFLMGSITGLIARDLLRKGTGKFLVVVVGFFTGPIGLLIAEVIWLIRGWSKSEEEVGF